MKYIIYSGLYLLAVYCLSAFVFDRANLYYEIPWLDIPMHVIGGFGVASLTLSIFSYKKQKISLTSVLLVYLLIAIGWELFEFYKDILASRSWNGWGDTLSDIVNGALGVLFAYFFLKK